jgi:hypothetical protein
MVTDERSGLTSRIEFIAQWPVSTPGKAWAWSFYICGAVSWPCAVSRAAFQLPFGCAATCGRVGVGCARGQYKNLAKTQPGATALLGDGSNPSPGPRRLVKTPDAGHPLPRGEGYDSGLCPRVQRKMWDAFSPRQRAMIPTSAPMSSRRHG